jgi:hypothetical protein
MKIQLPTGVNFFAFFKSAFGSFFHFCMLNLAFSGYWHLATLLLSLDVD